MTEPKAYAINLKENELRALLLWLNRVQITGQEADSIVYMKNLLSKPLIEAETNIIKMNDNKKDK